MPTRNIWYIRQLHLEQQGVELPLWHYAARATGGGARLLFEHNFYVIDCRDRPYLEGESRTLSGRSDSCMHDH